MYQKIMVPVDLAHIERLDKAITTATDLAKHYGIPICFVGATAETPGPVAHSPKEFAEKLAAFGADQSKKHHIDIETAAYPSHDPAIDLDKTLIAAARENGADLIVMASHRPELKDYLLGPNSARVVRHAECSVLVVRG